MISYRNTFSPLFTNIPLYINKLYPIIKTKKRRGWDLNPRLLSEIWSRARPLSPLGHRGSYKYAAEGIRTPDGSTPSGLEPDPFNRSGTAA